VLGARHDFFVGYFSLLFEVEIAVDYVVGFVACLLPFLVAWVASSFHSFHFRKA